jgi:hypothetical protein
LLADWAMATRFEKDQIIFRAGETANCFCLIESGKVVLESGEDVGGALGVIDTIGPGDLLGWSWIFPPCVWHFGPRRRADDVDLLLRHNPSRVMRQGFDPGLRVVQADE